MTQPHATHPGRRDHKPTLAQFVGDTQLTKRWLLERELNNGLLDLLGHPILQHRLLAADLLQRQLAALIVQLFETVEAVAAIPHHLAGLADIAELLGKLQQTNLRPDDLLLLRHIVISVPPASGSRFQHRMRTAPRPRLRFGNQQRLSD